MVNQIVTLSQDRNLTIKGALILSSMVVSTSKIMSLVNKIEV